MNRPLLAALALHLALPALAAEDSTGPVIANVSVTPATTDTSAGHAYVTVCMAASDDLSGLGGITARFVGTKFLQGRR